MKKVIELEADMLFEDITVAGEKGVISNLEKYLLTIMKIERLEELTITIKAVNVPEEED